LYKEERFFPIGFGRLLSRLLAVMSWAQRTRTTRNRVVNPWASFWNRSALRPIDKWIQPFLQKYLAKAIKDKGGKDDISSGVLSTLEVAQVARGSRR